MNRKPYSQKQPGTWWLRNPAYRRYMLREATAIPLFAYCVFLVYGLYCLGRGDSAFIAWLAQLRSTPAVALQLVALAAAIFHAWTWIELVPKILVLDKPPFKVSGSLIKRGHQLLALAAFLAIVGLLLSSLTANMNRPAATGGPIAGSSPGREG